MAMKEMDAWNQWGELCELSRCDAEAQDILNTIGDDLLGKGVARLPETVQRTVHPSRDYGFSLLELFSLTKHHGEQTRDRRLWGKSYKHGMFARAQKDRRPTEEVLRRLAFPMVRTAVREAWIKDVEKVEMKSLFDPVGSEGGLTLGDLIPDANAHDDPAMKELLGIAERDAQEVFEQMPFVHRVILLARALGVPYSNSPVVQKITDKGASSLGDQFKYIYRRCDYRAILEKKYPNEDPETLNVLYRMVLGYCEQRAISWGHSESRCAPLFALIETDDTNKEVR